MIIKPNNSETKETKETYKVDKKAFSMYIENIEGEYVEYDDMGNMMTYKYRERNKLFLYTLSEEFYKYELAQVLVYNNTDFPGIAPANFCYTNINGGCGAFAGLARVETDWITKEFIENNR
jgi:hypothetical protein